jgi:hypothetical protein
MASDIWLPLSVDERNLLREALAAYAIDGNAEKAFALSKKIASAPPYPDIIVGVHGGVLQWILGNPFPIRVCDNDGEEEDRPYLDERGQRCMMRFESADAELS